MEAFVRAKKDIALRAEKTNRDLNTQIAVEKIEENIPLPKKNTNVKKPVEEIKEGYTNPATIRAIKDYKERDRKYRESVQTGIEVENIKLQQEPVLAPELDAVSQALVDIFNSYKRELGWRLIPLLQGLYRSAQLKALLKNSDYINDFLKGRPLDTDADIEALANDIVPLMGGVIQRQYLPENDVVFGNPAVGRIAGRTAQGIPANVAVNPRLNEEPAGLEENPADQPEQPRGAAPRPEARPRLPLPDLIEDYGENALDGASSSRFIPPEYGEDVELPSNQEFQYEGENADLPLPSFSDKMDDEPQRALLKAEIAEEYNMIARLLPELGFPPIKNSKAVRKAELSMRFKEIDAAMRKYLGFPRDQLIRISPGDIRDRASALREGGIRMDELLPVEEKAVFVDDVAPLVPLRRDTSKSSQIVRADMTQLMSNLELLSVREIKQFVATAPNKEYLRGILKSLGTTVSSSYSRDALERIAAAELIKIKRTHNARELLKDIQLYGREEPKRGYDPSDVVSRNKQRAGVKPAVVRPNRRTRNVISLADLPPLPATSSITTGKKKGNGIVNNRINRPKVTILPIGKKTGMGAALGSLLAQLDAKKKRQ